MNIKPVITQCVGAKATHFNLELEAWELQQTVTLTPPTDEQASLELSRLVSRDRLLEIYDSLLQTTVSGCAACTFYDLERPDDCPNGTRFDFITENVNRK